MWLVTELHVHPFLRCNIWHLRGPDGDVVVDAGLGVHSLRGGVPHLFERGGDRGGPLDAGLSDEGGHGLRL